MTAPRNPFRPSFGASPYYLAGRDDLLRQFKLSLMEGPGSPHRALLLSGVRGVGKTVLLNELEDTSAQAGWITIRCYPHSNMIQELIETTLPRAITALNPPPQRKVSGGSIPGVGGIRTDRNPDAAALETAPTLITRLRELTACLKGTGILLTLDELQAANADQLHLLATAVQDLIRDDEDIALACAGLPHGIEELLQHEGTTFMRRATRVDLHSVSNEDVAATIRKTIEDAGKAITDDALDEATALCQGYPYLIQVVGSLAWASSNLDGAKEISVQHVTDIANDAVSRMMNQVHRPGLTKVPSGELAFLRAMAHSNASEVPTGEIAKALGVPPNGISTRRQRLIDRDLIEPAGFGAVRFTLPYLGEYLRQMDS
ncbi:ATP-binding protein [uncultured Corynebacterium sp.]|uniref:ATP-binding protein n=1 Tax=uncultured Corynebacterium sp. TaxID=159447 RepID=UPI0025DFCA7D|nr:ATP-binding protein [uncultured Corynebacterium sp.]